MTIVVGTLLALTAPRRAIPLLGVVIAMVSAEWLGTRSWAAVGIDLLLCAAFCLVAPASWRWLCSPQQVPALNSLLAYGAYLVLGAAVVGTLGIALPTALNLPWSYVIEPSSLGVVLVLFLVGGWGLGRDIDLEEGFAAERRRAGQFAIEAERAQILALRAHLDPHFLFNTLNAIAEWCREDPLVAESATLKLAAMLRTILEAIRKPTWPLAEELALLRKLSELYQVRDSERYQLDLEAPEPVPSIEVPPMLLLPLFENAITHGPSAGHAGRVTMRVTGFASGVLVEIRNPGRYTGRREGGEGIAIVERRLALAYAGRARLSLQAEGATTVTTLSLPLEPSSQEQLP